MNSYYYPVVYQPAQYAVSSMVPIMVGIMMTVAILGMLRDLVKGVEVKMPIEPSI